MTALKEAPQQTALLLEAYNPKLFDQNGQSVLKVLSEYLQTVTCKEYSVLTSFEPDRLLNEFQSAFQPVETAGQPFEKLLRQVISKAHHLHHPGFFCAQVVPVLPLTVWTEAVVTLLNNSTAVFEMGPVSTVLETIMADWLCEKIGYPAGQAGGLFTNGGSLGNLTGLLAARQVKAGYDLWEEGSHQNDTRYTVLVSEQAHYCVQRAVQIMGLGKSGATLVSTDSDYRITLDSLVAAYQKAKAQGLTPIAVAASACTTATGAYDPLDAVADFCEEHDLWLHVDGAHGASVLMSDRYKTLVKGIERADSVIWDLHKTMALPLTTTAILFKNKGNSFESFRQKASYLFGDSDELPWYQLGMRTLECSKRNMGLSLWMALQIYGEAFFRDYIEYTYDLAAAFAETVVHEKDFELAVRPQSNIVCFRYKPSELNSSQTGGLELDALQQHLRGLINQSGQYTLGSARLSSGLFLRVVFMNPLTTLQDAQGLLTAIRSAC